VFTELAVASRRLNVPASSSAVVRRLLLVLALRVLMKIWAGP
jgi:hypothetical protein